MATFFNTEDFDLGQEVEEMAFNERYPIARRKMIKQEFNYKSKKLFSTFFYGELGIQLITAM